MGWFEQPGVSETLACAAGALAYIASLAFGFVYDDIPQIVSNPAIQNWHSVPQYFTGHVWAAIFPNTVGNYYRPLFLVWLRGNYAVFGTSTWGWHSTAILCHVFATWLVLRLAVKLTDDRLTGFICALLFALHPAHIENVAWISGTTDILAACFMLGSILLLLESREKAARRISSVILFALALLCKESCVVLPLLVFALRLLEQKDSAQNRKIRSAALSALPYVLVLVAYAMVRFLVLHGWSHATIQLKWSQVLLTWPSVAWFYVRHLFLPFKTSEFYSLDYAYGFSLRGVVLPCVFAATAIAALWSIVRLVSGEDERASPAARLSLALMILPLIPVFDLRSLTPGDIVHDRYLYLPSVGFSLLAAITVRVLLRKRSAIQIAVVGMIATFFAGVTIVEQMQWSDDVALFSRGVEFAPNNLTVRDNLANALLDKHPEKAIPIYLEVLKRNPQFWRSNYNLGVAHYKLEKYPEAEGFLQRAINVDSSDPDQYIYLALTDARLQKFTEAKEAAESAIARNPSGRGYHAVLGMIAEATADRENAIREFKVEVTLHPDNVPAAAQLEGLERRGSTLR